MSIGADPIAPRQNPVTELAVLGVLIVGLFAGLIWLTGLAGVEETPESAGSSLSAGRRGTLALYRWLGRSGFDVRRVQGGEQFPPDADTLFMVDPNSDFPEGQAGSVREWVERGNTLVLAVSRRAGEPSTDLLGTHPMLRELGIGLAVSTRYTNTVAPAQPFFNNPPVRQVTMPGAYHLELPTDATVLASTRDDDGNRLPMVAMLRVGEGQVFVFSSDYALSNDGIRDLDNGDFVYNIVQMAGGKRVAFDEAHHGLSVDGDLLALLTGNPWGWALIYGALLLGIYFWWSARRLGPPLPVPTPDRRRPTSDYVTSVASLFRRARKPGYAAERYLRFFKRTLSRHAELDPYLTDSRFVQALQERGRHAFNPAEMLRAIERLRQLEGGGASASEQVEFETLKAIREAERVRKEALGQPGET